MLASGIGLGVLGGASSIIRSVVFSTLGATTLPSGMFFSRGSVGRVKTGDGTRANLTSGQAGIGLSLQHGYTGLVHEASSTFLFKNSAQPGGTSWSTTAHGSVASDGAAPPEGGTSTQHFADVSLGDTTYQQVTLDASSSYTVQAWLRPHTASGSCVQFALADVGTYLHFSGWLGDNDWRHFFGTVSGAAAGAGIFKFSSTDFRPQTAGPDNGILSTLQDFDAAEVSLEKKPYPTSMITTPSAATATRSASFFGFSSAAAQLDATGRLTLRLTIVPHGKHADYTADFYLWFVDASNYAKVTASTRILTVVIGGSTVYTADTALAWWQGRPLDIYLAVGGGAATKFGWQKWGSGWTMAGDGATVAALGFGAVSLYLLSGSSDATHFDCIVQSVVVGKTRYNPATNTTVLAATNVVCDGNSLTAGTGASVTLARWPEQASRTLGEGISLDYASAVAGQTTGQMSDDYATDIAPKYNPSARRNILVAWEITNDLIAYLLANGGSTDPDLDTADVNAAMAYVCGRFQTYCETAQATGWSVVAVDVIARGHTASGAGSNVPVSFEPARQLVNSWLAANYMTFSSRLAQPGGHVKLGDPTIMADGSLIWSSDGVHCSNLGYDVVEHYIVHEIEALAA